ncbi:hypothetical protein DL764_010569 [Monosporascus ibericus]|uniref:TLC domain-containing protein n=1 Tax=Monosporascus ibericus TaxID=155417 RepID=A0A4Q4SUM5_9PEZI|nr:hypothetical protein DL764_010569 [Monosporascus ibericus]
MLSIDRINSNATLAAALTLYPLVFRLAVRGHVTPKRLIVSREAISALHSLLISFASAAELYRQYEKWAPPAYRGRRAAKDDPAGARGPRPTLDIIDAQSPLGNAIVAWECGYLIGDLVALILGARRTTVDGQSRSIVGRSMNWKLLGWHHLGIGSALALFHIQACRGKEKGVLVVLLMFLMNISTPFGTLHWYLAKFRPANQMMVLLTHTAYLATYGLCRQIGNFGFR